MRGSAWAAATMAAEVNGRVRSMSAPCHERTASPSLARWSSTHGRIHAVAPGAERRGHRGHVGAAVEQVAAARRSACWPSPRRARRSAPWWPPSHPPPPGRAGRAGAGRRCAAGHPRARRWWGRRAPGRSTRPGRGPPGTRRRTRRRGGARRVGIGGGADEHDGEVPVLVGEHVHLVAVEDAGPRHRAGHRTRAGAAAAPVGAGHVGHAGVAAEIATPPPATAARAGPLRRSPGRPRP